MAVLTGRAVKEGMGTTITTMTGNPRPPVKCKSGEVLKGGVCIIVTTPPPLCKSGKVLSDGSCVPKTPITCTPDQILMKGQMRSKAGGLQTHLPAIQHVFNHLWIAPRHRMILNVHHRHHAIRKIDIKCPCPTGQHRDSNNQCVSNTPICPGRLGIDEPAFTMSKS